MRAMLISPCLCTRLGHAVRIWPKEVFLEPAVLRVRAVDTLVVVTLAALTASVLAARAVSPVASQVKGAATPSQRAGPTIHIPVQVSDTYCKIKNVLKMK